MLTSPAKDTTTDDATTPGDDAAADAAMLRAAQEADGVLPTSQTETDASSQNQPEGTSKKDATGKPADASQETAKPAGKGNEAKPGDKPENKGTEKPLTEFEKAKKEKERAAEVLKGFQKEKEQLRARDQAREAELKQLRAEVQALKKPAAGPAKDQHGFTAETYEKLAKQYEEQGNDEMAQAAREKVAELRAKATAPAAANAAEPWKDPAFEAEWQGHVKQLIDADPSLADPANPVVVATQGLLNNPVYGRYFRNFPDGIKMAHEVALLMRDAQTASSAKEQLAAKETELKTARAEIERLTGLLQPRGSLPGKPPAGEKDFADMTEEEQDAHMRRVAEAADRGEKS